MRFSYFKSMIIGLGLFLPAHDLWAICTPTFTATSTACATSTNTPTNTNTPTKTPTSTWTGTWITDTPVNTSTPTPTYTPSFTRTYTPTNTSTDTPTSTPVGLGQVNIISHSSPSTLVTYPNVGSLVFDFYLTNSQWAPFDINSIRFDATGTGNDQTDIAYAELWFDPNNQGYVDSSSIYLGKQSYSTDNGSVTFSGAPLVTLEDSQTRRFLLVYQFAPSTVRNATFQASLNPGGIQGSARCSLESLSLSGAPQSGQPVFTNYLPSPPTLTYTFPPGTNTPTFTPSIVLTPTPGNSNTSTRTTTPTFTLTGTIPSCPAPPTKTRTPMPCGPSMTNTPFLNLTASDTPSPTKTPTFSPTDTLTNTPTVTGTLNTSTPTNTATPTPTNSPTKTPTNTPTPSLTNTQLVPPTPTNTSTKTPSNSPTSTGSPQPTNTPTNSPTVTPTWTAMPGVNLVALGPNSPSGSTQLPGSTDVPMLQFKVTNPAGMPVSLSGLTLTAAGSGNDVTAVTAVNLYLDANGNGLVDGGDTLLGTSTYSFDNGTAVISFNNVIFSPSTNTYLVTYNFAGIATGTFSTGIASSSAITVSNAPGTEAFVGLPLTGGTVGLAGTATPTNTVFSSTSPTKTPTVTPTNTPTSTTTNTRTMTPSFTPTSTPTKTPTRTSTDTPTTTVTNSATPTGTWYSPTPVPAAILISLGPNNPPDSFQPTGNGNVPVIQFIASNTGSVPVTMSGITLAASGSGDDGAGIANAHLWLDNNQNGYVDGGDVLPDSTLYSGDNGTAHFNLTNVIPPGGTATYLLTYDLSAAALSGTFQASILSSASFTTLNAPGSVFFSGLPLTSSVITIGLGTLVPTATHTDTPTPVCPMPFSSNYPFDSSIGCWITANNFTTSTVQWTGVAPGGSTSGGGALQANVTYPPGQTNEDFEVPLPVNTDLTGKTITFNIYVEGAFGGTYGGIQTYVKTGPAYLFCNQSWINITSFDAWHSYSMDLNSGCTTGITDVRAIGAQVFVGGVPSSASGHVYIDDVTIVTVATPTFTPTGTWFTSTATKSPTPTPSNTPTNTPTVTSSPTLTPTNTKTFTPTSTPTGTWATSTPTNSPTPTPPAFTNTPTPFGPTDTFTDTPTPTNSPSITPTKTYTFTVTNTLTGGLQPTNTATMTPTRTPSNSPTLTSTNTITQTFTGTWNTATATNSPTITPTFTPSSTPTNSPTKTLTNTPTNTPTNSLTNTVTPSITRTPTLTFTSSPTVTDTSSYTPTGTWNTSTPTNSPNITLTNTVTPTKTPTPTLTNTNTRTTTNTPTNTATLTPAGMTNTPTYTFTITPTYTPTPAGTPLVLASVVVNPALPAVVSLTSGSSIIIPSGSFTQPVTITLSQYASGSAPSTSTAFTLSFMPYAYVIDTGGYEPLPGSSVTISLSYDPADIPAGYTEADLKGTYFDGTSWVVVPAVIDTVNHLVTIVTDHFSWWAVVFHGHTPTPTATSNPQGVPVVYPNPAEGNSVQLTLPFLTAPADVKLQIFSVSFRKVQDLVIPHVAVGTVLTVDLLDKAGARLSNGLYYLLVSTPTGGRHIVKLIVAR